MLGFSLFGLFSGCSGQKRPAHSPQELTAVSIACGEMDRTHSYSFTARRDGERWLFDADCFVRDFAEEAAVRDVELAAEDVRSMLELFETGGYIASVEQHQTSPRAGAADGSVYSVCLTFSDGSRTMGAVRLEGLEQLFYRLAEAGSDGAKPDGRT